MTGFGLTITASIQPDPDLGQRICFMMTKQKRNKPKQKIREKKVKNASDILKNGKTFREY